MSNEGAEGMEVETNTNVDEIVRGDLTRKAIDSHEQRKNEGKSKLSFQNNLYPKLGANFQKREENTDVDQKIEKLEEENIMCLKKQSTNVKFKMAKNPSDDQKIKNLKEWIMCLANQLADAQFDYKQVLKERNEVLKERNEVLKERTVAKAKWGLAAYSIFRLEKHIKELEILNEKECEARQKQVKNWMCACKEKTKENKDLQKQVEDLSCAYKEAQHLLSKSNYSYDNMKKKCNIKIKNMEAQISILKEDCRRALDAANIAAKSKVQRSVTTQTEFANENFVLSDELVQLLEKENANLKTEIGRINKVSKDSRDEDGQLNSNLQQSVCTPFPKMRKIEDKVINPTIEKMQTKPTVQPLISNEEKVIKHTIKKMQTTSTVQQFVSKEDQVINTTIEKIHTKPTVQTLISKEENIPNIICQSMNREKQAKSTIKASLLKYERCPNGTDLSPSRDSAKAPNIKNTSVICSSREERQVKSRVQNFKTLPVKNILHMNQMKTNNSKNPYNMLGMFLGFIIGVIVICLGSMDLKNEPMYMKNELMYMKNEPMYMENEGMYMENELVKHIDFNSIISNLNNSFIGQPEMSFKVVISALKAVSAPDPKAPAIILLLASKGAEKLALNLGNALVSSVSSSPIEISGKYYQTQGINIGKKSLDEALLVMDATADSQFNAVLVKDLHLIPGETALMLHTYCDSDYAPYKHVVYVLIVNMEEEIKRTRKEWDRAAMKRLDEAWNDIDLDQKDPLLSRLTVSVAAVFDNKSEKEQEIYS